MRGDLRKRGLYDRHRVCVSWALFDTRFETTRIPHEPGGCLGIFLRQMNRVPDFFTIGGVMSRLATLLQPPHPQRDPARHRSGEKGDRQR